MKIAIIGFSGSGKSTLARKLGEKYGIPVLHMDRVHWKPNWVENTREDEIKVVEDFLKDHDSWVIDGNYFRICAEERFSEADKILLLLFSPLACYLRAKRRLKRYKGRSRPDMTEGCNEKIDREFRRWIFFDGRNKKKREQYRKIITEYKDKAVILRNQRQLTKYCKEHDLKTE